MTIGIGVLGTSGSVYKPDTVVLAADTQGSFGDWYSTPGLHKLFVHAEDSLYVAAAGRMDRAAELVPILLASLRNVSAREHGPIQDALVKAVKGYRQARVNYEVLPKFGIKPEDWWSAKLDWDDRQKIMEECALFDIGVEMIIGTFTDQGQALLYRVPSVAFQQNKNGGPYTVEFVSPENFPGFAAIGSGAHFAQFWLSHRDHQLGYSSKRSAYYAYEARRMAETNPYVNDQIELVIATRTNHSCLSAKSRRLVNGRSKSSRNSTSVTDPKVRRCFKNHSRYCGWHRGSCLVH